MLQAAEFHDYACAKAYDMLSRGKYKKFLIQSKAAGEEWACKSVKSVQVKIGAHDLSKIPPVQLYPVQKVCIWMHRELHSKRVTILYDNCSKIIAFCAGSSEDNG